MRLKATNKNVSDSPSQVGLMFVIGLFVHAVMTKLALDIAKVPICVMYEHSSYLLTLCSYYDPDFQSGHKISKRQGWQN